jgi:hypothetical protein
MTPRVAGDEVTIVACLVVSKVNYSIIREAAAAGPGPAAGRAQSGAGRKNHVQDGDAVTQKASALAWTAGLPCHAG